MGSWKLEAGTGNWKLETGNWKLELVAALLINKADGFGRRCSVSSLAGGCASLIYSSTLAAPVGHDKHCVCDRHRVRCGGGRSQCASPSIREHANDIRANADAERWCCRSADSGDTDHAARREHLGG